MKIYLSSKDPAVLNKARGCLKSLPEQFAITEEKLSADNTEFAINMPEEDCENLLNKLLNNFPDLDIAATVISDIEGRDRSFWSTTSYKSSVNKDGKRYFEIGRSSGWA